MKHSIEDLPIAIVGAGNLATNLAKALYRNGFRIVQVYSRTETSARTLAAEVEAGYTARLDGLTDEAQLYIVALTDMALVQLLPELVCGREAALWVHTAGSVPMDVWKNHAERYGVFYPMQTFSKERAVDFREIPVFVEACRPADAALLKEVAAVLSDRVYDATSEQRKWLHLAAVCACNFTNHFYELAASLLVREGMPFDVMLPLIDETARKVHGLTPHDAQTGPAVRFDKNVMEKHLQLLADTPSLQDIYKQISESIYLHHTDKQDNI